MRVALTGASGLVGRFVHRGLSAAGHEVVTLGRGGGADRPFSLGETGPDLNGVDALVHLALSHLPGRYRGGEGDDPEGFRELNRGGTERLFAAARMAGVGRIVFLSSRAVYGVQPEGMPLIETTPCRPDTEYGRVKLAGEAAARDSGVISTALRATGVYGPAPDGAHKWTDLFADLRAGREIAPRVGTEVHGDDLAAAVALVLDHPAPPAILNVSDIMLDRRDLLRIASDAMGLVAPLPERADATRVNEMDTRALRALGWMPGGWDALRDAVTRMV